MGRPRWTRVAALLACACVGTGAAAASELETQSRVEPGTDIVGVKTARIGLYVTALRLRVVENEYDVEFWLWATEPAAIEGWNPLDSIEVVDAKRIEVRYPGTIVGTERFGDDWPAGTVVRRHLQKVTATLPHAWDMHNYPFDRHTLSIRLEDGVEPVTSVVYIADRRASGMAEELRHFEGWTSSGFRMHEGSTWYATTFGDPSLPAESGSEWTRVIAQIDLERQSIVSFWKLTAGVYVAFMIAALAFFLDPAERGLTNPRISMLVGSLFAAVVNMRAAQLSFGQTEAITVVDRVHIVTLLFLFVACVMTIVSRMLIESGQQTLARTLDRRVGFVAFTSAYVVINVLMIIDAATEG